MPNGISRAKSANTTGVSVYVDGFNLYFGMRDCGFQRYFWLNIFALASHFLRPTDVLSDAKYFTARISGPQDKARRQQTYLEALGTVVGLDVFEGRYLFKQVSCKKCGATWPSPEEKMTDVNIATEMLKDAFSDRYDRAILVSGDSDLVPPIRVIQGSLLKKEVVVAFPPRRHSAALKQTANNSFFINQSALAQCQFPNQIQRADGYMLSRPQSWT